MNSSLRAMTMPTSIDSGAGDGVLCSWILRSLVTPVLLNIGAEVTAEEGVALDPHALSHNSVKLASQYFCANSLRTLRIAARSARVISVLPKRRSRRKLSFIFDSW